MTPSCKVFVAVIASGLIAAGVMSTSSALAQQEVSTERNLDGFAAARTEILTLIGGATQSIRIATDFLSDGEIASALYIAQYRKVNVQVLLGPAKATSVLSRLSFLKAQNIPVWLRPRGFMASHPTVIQVDQNLYSLNADLDYMARHRKFILSPLPATQNKAFEDGFETASTSGISPDPKPLPLVGKPGSGPRRRTPPTKAAHANSENGTGTESMPDQASASDANGNAPYRYNRKKEKPTNGIPTKLPKTTILQERSRQENESGSNH